MSSTTAQAPRPSNVSAGANAALTIQPYLFFDGRCEEAANFYCRTLGAQISMSMRFKDNPDAPMSEGCAAPGDPNKIMHMELRIGSATLLASDGNCEGKPAFQGISLSLTAPDAATAERMFNALAQENGQVQMPLGKTFFSPAFGMVADRFGVSWMIYVAPKS